MTATDDALEAMREALAEKDTERFVELLRTLATLDPEAAGMVATVMNATGGRGGVTFVGRLEKMAGAHGPTWVYQVRCEHEGLLYVGIASDLERRVAQHRSTKDWWADVDYVCATLEPTRSAAFALEARMISGLHPPRNIAGKPHAAPGRPMSWRLLDQFGHLIKSGDG